MQVGKRCRGRRVGLAPIAFALLVSGTGLGACAWAQDRPERTDRDPARRLRELKEAAATYVIERESEPPARLALVPEPALRWSNPVRVAYDGAVFVWVADGRPEVVASFYRTVERGMAWEHHEFQSLSESRLAARVGNRTAWAPRSPGVALKPIPGAPAPAADAPGRLRQMRALAREFHAGYANEAKSRGLSLRLLTQPLHRYANGRPSGSDGAVFAFVQATDPEALLVIEARSSGGSPAWHFSFAPMSGRGLRGWHRDELVWEVSNMPSDRSDAPYINIAVAVPPQ